MIKRLKRKFVAIMMSMVTVILLAIFLSLLISTQNTIQRSSLGILRQALLERTPMHVPMGQAGGDPPMEFPANFRMPTATIRIGPDGAAQVLNNRIYSLEDEEAVAAAQRAAQGGEETGVLRDSNLRYLVETMQEGMVVALADTSMESSVIRDLVGNCLLVGGAAFLVFLALSVFFARWAVKPVQQAWDRQRQFVADASHELKTPLTVILSNVEMLTSGEATDEKDARRKENIHAEGVRMKRLIQDMLALARSDQAQKPRPYQPVCFSDVAMDSVLLFESAIYEDGKRLDYHIEEGILVQGDPGSLRQLVDVLLDNAVKYTKKGSGIRINLKRIPRRAMQLSVANDGNPIPEEKLETIFRRFYRADPARGHNGGFGLGLSIAQGIAAEHGGRIWAERDGAFNVFHVVLPCAAKEPAQSI